MLRTARGGFKKVSAGERGCTVTVKLREGDNKRGRGPARPFPESALRIVVYVMATASLVSGKAAEPFRYTLTSVEHNVHVDQWKITQRELNLEKTGRWAVRKTTLHGGKQEGVDLIELDNGRLRLTVIATRGMGVLKVEFGDVRLGWDSPVKEVVHPQFINLQNRGGLGWLEGFNEWMVRCGLEYAGHPGKDKFINNVGDEAEMDLTVHGRIANVPASEVEVLIDRDSPHRLRVRGRVDERMFYGPKLELWTEISTEPGSSEFRIDDSIRNLGAFDQEFQIIYHSNYGRPLLEQGSKFVGAVQRVTPFNTQAAKGVSRFADYDGPMKGFIEQVYCIYPIADEHHRTVAMLENAGGDRAVSLSFSVLELPYFTLWKNTSALEEGYVTGLEPGTGFPYNRRIERQFGRVPKLKPGESRHFTIDFAIHSGKDAVRSMADRIARIQHGRTPQVDPEPARIE